MKRFVPFAWYGAAALSVVAMWAQWEWAKGLIDGWFPLFCVVSAQLSRIRLGLPSNILDRTFQSRLAEKLAIGSLAVAVAGIVIWGAWLKYFYMPQSHAESVEQFKKDWAAYQEQKK